MSVPSLHILPMTACPGCHSPSARDIKLGTAPLKQCTVCSLVYAPEYADPDEVYVEGYHSGGHGNFGVDVTHPEWDELLAYVGQRRVGALKKVTSPPGRFLDVGCGPGHTLSEARKLGWDPVGVELVPSAAQTARDRFDLEVHNCLLEESGLPERSFDVVAATHVLEHMQDGAGFLATMGRWVKPGGHILIEVPNWNSADRRGNGQDWIGLRPLEHIGHYTPKTLASTFRRIGFTPVVTKTPFYMFYRQSFGQALRDMGMSKYVPRLERRVFTVEGKQQDDVVRLPNAAVRQVLLGVTGVEGALGAGSVIVMAARVP